MELANIFIAKLLGIIVMITAFMNLRRGAMPALNLKKGDVLFTLAIIGKFALALGLVLLPNMK
jgi:hypothetical protein